VNFNPSAYEDGYFSSSAVQLQIRLNFENLNLVFSGIAEKNDVEILLLSVPLFALKSDDFFHERIV